MAVFVDTKGNRHEKVELPASLLKPGVSRRQQEAYLIKSGQINTEPLPVITEPEAVQQQVIDDGVVSALEGRLAVLEQRPPSLTPDAASLERLAISVQRASVSKEEIVQVADDATDKIQTVATGFEDRLKTAESREQALLEAVSEGVSKGEENISLAVTALQQAGASAIVEIEKESLSVAKREARSEANRVAQAESLRHWGSSVTICPESPEDVDNSSWAKRWYGRDQLIEGDGAFVTSKDGITAFRYAGGQWIRSAELLPRVEIASQNISVLDQSQPATVVLGASGGSGGSGGGDRLAAKQTAAGASTVVADASNWGATAADIRSGSLSLCLEDFGTARRKYVTVAFVERKSGGFDQTEYAEIGDLSDPIAISFSRSPASTASGGIAPYTAIRISLTVTSLTGGPYVLSGVVNWAMPSNGTVSTSGGSAPLWVWA